MSGFTINTVVVSGNLTRDPELRSLPSGSTVVCELGLAVNERIKDSASGEWTDRPNYFDITVWGGMGEWCARNLGKGDGLAVEGRLRWESWEKDGQKRSKVKIVANSISPRERSGNGIAPPNGGSGQQGFTDVPASPPAAGFGVPTSGGDEDIPF